MTISVQTPRGSEIVNTCITTFLVPRALAWSASSARNARWLSTDSEVDPVTSSQAVVNQPLSEESATRSRSDKHHFYPVVLTASTFFSTLFSTTITINFLQSSCPTSGCQSKEETPPTPSGQWWTCSMSKKWNSVLSLWDIGAVCYYSITCFFPTEHEHLSCNLLSLDIVFIRCSHNETRSWNLFIFHCCVVFHHIIRPHFLNSFFLMMSILVTANTLLLLVHRCLATIQNRKYLKSTRLFIIYLTATLDLTWPELL